jgi:tetratricopeptide (TPR) repeat protein
MVIHIPNKKFFVAGGTVRFDSPSYVERPADTRLFDFIQDGEFCYVLAARQMGKSSLMVRTNYRLQQLGVQTVVIDLNQIGAKDVTADQWYFGIIREIKRRLRLSIDPQTWWAENAAISYVQRFYSFLHDVVLTEIKNQIVIFIDEIDYTLELDFTDDFFAAVRATYNNRSLSPEFNRLTFVLLGVATPFDLVKDSNSTPFNIGQEIILDNLKREDAEKLQIGLQHICQDPDHPILDCIFYWTNGHPYLTQRLCESVVKGEDKYWSDEDVGALVHELFFSDKGRDEVHLQSIENYVNQHSNRPQLVALYRQIYTKGQIYEDKSSLEQTYLKLSGLVRADKGRLQVRNEIYRRIFDRDWIKANTPIDLKLRIAVFAAIVATVVAATLGYLVWQNRQASPEVLAEKYIAQFEKDQEPALRLTSLTDLLALPDTAYHAQAYSLFEDLSLEEKVALFSVDLSTTSEWQSGVRALVKQTYLDLANTQDNNRLLEAMVVALNQSNEIESLFLAREIDEWVAGRRAFLEKNYQEAKTHYDGSIALNKANAIVYLERAMVLVELGDYNAALADFQKALELDETLEKRVEQSLRENTKLYTAWWDKKEDHPRLVAILPPPVSTATPSVVESTITKDAAKRVITPMAINISLPTDTPTPTRTPTPTNTPRPTSTPRPSPIASTATPVAEVIYARSGGQTHDLGRAFSSGFSRPGEETLFVHAAAPALSPDGTKIAFFGQPGIDHEDPAFKAGEGVWVVERGGTNPKQLVKTDHVKNLAWSPDGLKLAFEIHLPDRNAEVVVINAVDGTPLSRFNGQQPAWSPNSEQLAIKACLPTCGIWQVNIDGSPIQPLTYFSTDSYPFWSPTGENLVYASEQDDNWDIYVLRLQDKTTRRLTFQRDIDTTPVFSPDGREIYYRRKRNDRVWQIVVMSLDNIENLGLVQDNVGPSDEWGLSRPAVHR